jgi:HEAT repeat protein
MGLNSGMYRFALRAALVLGLLLPTAGVLQAAPDSASLSATTQVEKVGDKKLSQWIADLRNSDPSVREEAIRAITFFGPAAAEAVPALLDRLHDSDASPRAKSIVALSIILKATKIDDAVRSKVVAALGEKMQTDNQAMVRYNAAVALSMIGKDTKGALPGLLHGMEDQASWEIRRVAIAAIIEAGATKTGPDPRATRALLASVEDRAAQVRLEAVLALGQMGRPDDGALLDRTLRVLKSMTADKDKTVDIWARLSLMALVDKVDDADLQFLSKCAKIGEVSRTRVQAVRALGTVGVKTKTVVPQLVDLLSDADSAVAGNACVALGGIRDPGANAEKALTDLSVNKEASEEVKKAALKALDDIKKGKGK